MKARITAVVILVVLASPQLNSQQGDHDLEIVGRVVAAVGGEQIIILSRGKSPEGYRASQRLIFRVHEVIKGEAPSGYVDVFYAGENSPFTEGSGISQPILRLWHLRLRISKDQGACRKIPLSSTSMALLARMQLPCYRLASDDFRSADAISRKNRI